MEKAQRGLDLIFVIKRGGRKISILLYLLPLNQLNQNGRERGGREIGERIIFPSQIKAPNKMKVKEKEKKGGYHTFSICGMSVC